MAYPSCEGDATQEREGRTALGPLSSLPAHFNDDRSHQGLQQRVPTPGEGTIPMLAATGVAQGVPILGGGLAQPQGLFHTVREWG